MRILIGYTPDTGGNEALALAVWLAQSHNGSLVVATIVPEGWLSAAGTDGEYGTFVRENARKGLEKAKSQVAGKVEADFVIRPAPSAREGLLAIAGDVSAEVLVIGSARGGPTGRFLEGSVANELVRSASMPVILCPRGYKPPVGTRLSRLSVAFSGASGSGQLVGQATYLAEELGVPVRVVSFVVRDKQMYPSGAGYDAENMVINQLRRQIGEAQQRVLGGLPAKKRPDAVIGDGPSWKDAMLSVGWETAELLVIGASSLGPIARVFLGSNSGKVLRNAPVPCVLLPRYSETD